MSNLLSGSLTVKIHFGGLAQIIERNDLALALKCPTCGSTDIDNDESAGQMVCVSCGEVVEEKYHRESGRVCEERRPFHDSS